MMNFAGHTPEALLPRSDSKNPATTCKGITSSGRPCRRSLSSSPRKFPGHSQLKSRGVLAVLRDQLEHRNTAAAFYCWQHKPQAELVAKTEQNHTELFHLQERTSVDTLVDRIGVMKIEENIRLKGTSKTRRKTRDSLSTAVESLPVDWQRMQGPLMSVPSDMVSPTAPTKPSRHRPPPRSNVKASLLCCVRDAGDEDHPALRPRPHRPVAVDPNQVVRIKQNHPLPVVHSVRQSSQNLSPIPRKPVPLTPKRDTALSSSLRTPSTPTRPKMAATPNSAGSQTQGLLSLIPTHLSPQSTSILLNELSKPISDADAEGYIYMFWLTPESDIGKPDDEAASDLLEPPSDHLSYDRRKSDVLHRYASQRRGLTQTKTVLLKIGRAENVHRRLSQWSKQCLYNITLIRYYPYTPSRTPQSGAQSLPRKLPHVHRVERLIHVELAEKRVREHGPCVNCGREHREWFEIEASRDGLRAVDEVIRRWVAWAERQG